MSPIESAPGFQRNPALLASCDKAGLASYALLNPRRRQWRENLNSSEPGRAAVHSIREEVLAAIQ